MNNAANVDVTSIKASIIEVWRAFPVSRRPDAARMIAALCRYAPDELVPFVRSLIDGVRGCGDALAILRGFDKSPGIEPTFPADQPPAPPALELSARAENPPLRTVEIDAELMRILSALNHAVPARLWAIARQITSSTTGRGVVDEREVIAAAVSAGVGCVKYIRRQLSAGDGVFWYRRNGHIRIVGYSKLAVWAVESALAANRAEIIGINMPGTAFIAVPIKGSVKQWKANLYVAWFNSRGSRTGNISRMTLSTLWGVTRKTLITWDKAAGIEAQKNYAHFTDASLIPAAYAFPVVIREGSELQIGAMGRISNSYDFPIMRQRFHKRTPRTVRRAMRGTLESINALELPNRIYGQPDTAQTVEGVGVSVTGRRHFMVTSRSKGDPTLQGFKRLRNHVRRHENDPAPHYAYLGALRGCFIYEQSTDGSQRRDLRVRVSRRVEDAYFQQHGGRSAWVRAWREYAAK